DAVDDGEGAGALLAVDGDVDLALAVDAHQAGLDGAGVHRRADVTQVDRVARLDADGDVVELGDGADHRVGVELELVAAEASDAGGYHEVGPAEGIDDVLGRELAGFQLQGIDVDEDGALLAAEDRGRDDALDAAELVADLDAGQVLQFRLVQVGAA